MINAIKKFLVTFEKQASAMPFATLLIVIATVLVANIPLRHLAHHALYTNEVYASVIIPSLPIISNLLLAIHIAAAIPAIAIGPFLFVPAWRAKYPRIHRQFGKIYVFGCLISAVTILPVATHNAHFFVSEVGFSVMAVFWFITTWSGYICAREKDFVAHRRWMMRSYAMTFAFVHVNLTYHLIGVYYAFDMVMVKIMQSMVSWLFNLIVVDFYLAATTHTGKFLGYKKWFHNLLNRSNYDKIRWRQKKKA